MKRTLIVALILSAILVVVTFFNYNGYKEQRYNIAISKGNDTALRVRYRIDSMAINIKASGDYVESVLESKDLTIDEIKELIVMESSKMDYLAGITVAFEPFAYTDTKRLVSLFYDAGSADFRTVHESYDYTDTTLLTTNWYSQTILSGMPNISKPYYGEVVQELVIDYSLPIFKTNADGEKEVQAVISYSITPYHFTEVINSFVQGNSGYVYLINESGTIITHPNRSRILDHKVLDHLTDNSQNDVVQSILSDSSGHVKFVSPYTSVPSILFFQTEPLTGWKIAVVYSETDLLGNPRVLEQKIIHIALSCSLMIILIFALSLRAHMGESSTLWAMSVIISTLFVINIALFWFLQLKIDYSEELENRTRVYSNNALNSFIEKKNYEQKLLGNEDYLQIPTGVYIEELLVSDSYNMSVSGKIWQKWPVDHDLNDNTGFQFIQASPLGRSVIVELLSKDKIDSATWLYTWKFNSSLRIFFDYKQYPLDQHYIDIKLIYPDMTDRIMLVPDFSSYEVLNPSARPGMSDIIFLPQHRIIASYFSFSSLDMKTFFGQDRVGASSQYETLEYNIVIKRRFITPFISFIIPFVLGASIIFFLLFSLTKDKEDKSGVTVMGVVQGMAALFFSLLLAHITIRNKIPSPEITYLETYYFVIYLLIALLILLVVVYTKSTKYKILNYKDNLIIKLLYWPFLTGMLYLITFLNFY